MTERYQVAVTNIFKQVSVAGFALAALLTINVSAGAQQAKSGALIGFLSSRSPEAEKSRRAAFQQGLKELGYVEGKNIVVEQRYAEGNFDRLPELAADLVRLKVDVIVATGAPASQAAKKTTRTVPIVMGNAADPVGTGLVASLARPGGNVTGLSDFAEGVITKRLELLKEVAPAIARVAVLLNPGNPSNPLQLKEVQAAAPSVGLALRAFEIKTPDDLDATFAAMKKQRSGALLVFGDPLLETSRRQIAKFAVENRLPAIYSHSGWMDAGGLMSYGVNFDDLYRRAAYYVDKILKGAKPADLPIEQPTKFELVINLKTAKQIGLTIPPNVLARADRVIK